MRHEAAAGDGAARRPGAGGEHVLGASGARIDCVADAILAAFYAAEAERREAALNPAAPKPPPEPPPHKIQ